MDGFYTRAGVSDACSWLTESIEASAVAAADEIYAGLGGRTPADLARHIEAGGLVPLLAWADAVVIAGLDHEPWARGAALRAVQAYVGRLGTLVACGGQGGVT